MRLGTTKRIYVASLAPLFETLQGAVEVAARLVVTERGPDLASINSVSRFFTRTAVGRYVGPSMPLQIARPVSCSNATWMARWCILRVGRQAEREHLVDTFAEAAADSLGTVEQQTNYYREWRLSLNR
jgi:hypothetical protein